MQILLNLRLGLFSPMFTIEVPFVIFVLLLLLEVLLLFLLLCYIVCRCCCICCLVCLLLYGCTCFCLHCVVCCSCFFRLTMYSFCGCWVVFRCTYLQPQLCQFPYHSTRPIQVSTQLKECLMGFRGPMASLKGLYHSTPPGKQQLRQINNSAYMAPSEIPLQL